TLHLRQGEYHEVGRGWINIVYVMFPFYLFLSNTYVTYFLFMTFLFHPLRRFTPRPPVSVGQFAGAV
ncbi:MAG: hypothetical protein IIW42_05935, partial [Bacteroidaceae bacterium]|nr:hypothetical protein [Bacteroidaceae bacterium]